ncbi:helix-turn-helix domain-containing protein [Bdellovibrionota bacterium FG-1]
MTHIERWLSVEEIAAHLGVSKETIYRWLDAGKIPAHRMGRLWKFKASEVDGWVCSGGAGVPDILGSSSPVGTEEVGGAAQ